MTPSEFNIKASREPTDLLVCFGQIRRDAITMRPVIDKVELMGEPAGGVTLGSEDLMSMLEFLVSAPAKKGTSSCGPVFWPIKGVEEIETEHTC